MNTYRISFTDYADGLYKHGKRVIVGTYHGRSAIEAISAMIADRISPQLREGEHERVVGPRRVVICGLTFEANLVGVATREVTPHPADWLAG